MKKLIKLLPIILLCLTPLIWFYGRGGFLINGVDTNFPLDPLAWFERRLYVWNTVVNGGMDFSSSTAGLFFHFIQVLPYSLGLNLELVQIFSLVFWFSVIVSSGFILAREILPKSFLAQILFTIIYAFNIYLFNSWENIKVANLSLMASIPFALVILIKLKNKSITKIKAAFFAALVGVLVSGTGINPAYLSSFFLVIAIFVLSQIIIERKKSEILNRIKEFALLTIIILLTNTFWIFPTTNFIFNTIPLSGSIEEIGFTNWTDSLSENTSLFNVLRLQGAWDWYAFDSRTGLPLFIPYALRYFYSFPFLVFSFLLTGLAILSLILRDNKRDHLYVFFTISMILGVFLGAGTHLPTGSLYAWMMSNIPFFSLFRSPWYIFTPLVVLSLAGLVGLLLQKLTEFESARIFRYIFASILIVGYLLYSYPLITGKIFRPNQNNGFYVKFPNYLYETKDWLKNNPLPQGRIISYPEDEIERFDWGYTGIESILGLFSKEEIIFSSLNSPNSALANISKEFYTNLRKGNIESAKAIANKLNISTVFEKKDQSSFSEDISPILRQYLIKSLGSWNFYDLSDENFLPKIFTTNSYILSIPYNSSAKIFAGLDAKDLVLNYNDSIVSKIPSIISSKQIILTDNSQETDEANFSLALSNLSNRLLTRDLSVVIYTFEITNEGEYQPQIEKYQLNEFGIDLTKGVNLELDGQNVLWETDRTSENYLYLKPVKLSVGKHQIKIALKNNNLVTGGNFEDGATFKRGGEGKGDGLYEILEEPNGNKYLSIFNVDKADISAEFSVNKFDPYAKYYIEMRYKQVYGNNSTVLTTQSHKGTLFKAEVERLPNYPEWRDFSFFYRPVNIASNMTVALQAPFTADPLGTKIFYDNLKVQKVFNNSLILTEVGLKQVPEFLAKAEFTKKSPVEYNVTVENATIPHALVFLENYSPDWEIEIFNESGKKIAINPPHFSANLYANAWFIEDPPLNYNAKIFYKPQKLYNLGLVVSILTFLVLTTLFVKGLVKRRVK